MELRQTEPRFLEIAGAVLWTCANRLDGERAIVRCNGVRRLCLLLSVVLQLRATEFGLTEDSFSVSESSDMFVPAIANIGEMSRIPQLV